MKESSRVFFINTVRAFSISSLHLYLTQVSLLPSVLARKRVWNRKYPICLVLAEGVQVEEEEILLPGSEDEERATEKPDLAEPHSHDTLYLFGRTGREKEDWFQHFLSASRASRLDRSPSREQSKAGTLMRFCRRVGDGFTMVER